MRRHASRVGRGAWQMQDDTADGADDMNAQLQEPVAQPGHLGSGTGGACGAQPELLHEHVGGGRQQDPQLVRGEPAAAGAVDLQPVEQFLGPVLDVTARAIDFLVEGPRRSTQVGHDEAGIVPRLAARGVGRPRP